MTTPTRPRPQPIKAKNMQRAGEIEKVLGIIDKYLSGSPADRAAAATDIVDEYTPWVDRSMRARQLVSTVRQGRKISIQIFDEYPFSGYLCGWDEDTYFLIIPNAEGGEPVKRLVPKASVQFIDLHDDRTFFEEDDHNKMVNIVKPFKDLINNLYFSQEG